MIAYPGSKNQTCDKQGVMSAWKEALAFLLKATSSMGIYAMGSSLQVQAAPHASLAVEQCYLL